MPRYRLTLEYDGTPYQGWQRQEGVATVQETIENALLAFAHEPARLTAAGRTDAGVHALGQVVNFDLEREWQATKIQAALNYYLKGKSIAVLDSRATTADFDARRHAIRRRYRYRLLGRRAPPALERDRVWHHPRSLDPERMHEAGQALVGRHDLTSFRASECQAKSPVKTIDRLHVRAVGDEIQLTIEAPSFLHHQVRNIVGTLALVGERKLDIRDIEGILTARDRSAAGPTAPAAGLYLVAVDYPAPAPA